MYFLCCSVCDVSGKGSFPTQTLGLASFYRSADGASGAGSGGGFLTFLFQADDAFCLDLGIAYAYAGTTSIRVVVLLHVTLPRNRR
jgi:hypothetical protein